MAFSVTSSAPASRPTSRGRSRPVRPRRLGYEFDMLQNRWDQSLPRQRQAFYFGSQAADIRAPGITWGEGAAIDALIAVLEARERPDFVSAVRALDRALSRASTLSPSLTCRSNGSRAESDRTACSDRANGLSRKPGAEAGSEMNHRATLLTEPK